MISTLLLLATCDSQKYILPFYLGIFTCIVVVVVVEFIDLELNDTIFTIFKIQICLKKNHE